MKASTHFQEAEERPVVGTHSEPEARHRDAFPLFQEPSKILNPQQPLSDFDAHLAIARASRHPSTQPSAAGLSDADNRMILDFLPPIAMIPGGRQDFMKQALSPVMPAISGIVGFAQGGMDRARAEAQAQREAQEEYERNNERTAAIADLAAPIPGKLEEGVKAGQAAGRAVGKVLPEISGAINHIGQAAEGLSNLDTIKQRIEGGFHLFNAARNAGVSQPDPGLTALHALLPPSPDSYSGFPDTQVGPSDASSMMPDATNGATYFYSGPEPQAGFFSSRIASGRLTPNENKFTFFRDTRK